MGSCLLSCISILRVIRLRFICLRQAVSNMRAMITIIPAGTRGDRSRLNAKGAVNIPIAKKIETTNRSGQKMEFSGLSFWIIPSINPFRRYFPAGSISSNWMDRLYLHRSSPPETVLKKQTTLPTKGVSPLKET
jgi:hypothetical protein